jgi:hypothetical protein
MRFTADKSCIRWVVGVLAMLWLLGGAWAHAAEDAVKVEKVEPQVEYKTFDPNHLPDPPPPLKGNEAAACVFGFAVDTGVKYGYRAPANAGAGRGPASATVDLSGVNVRIKLTVTVWLPNNANAQLKAHEEGHRAITDYYYKTPEQVARPIARKVVGRKVPIRADDLDAAARAEIERINKELGDEILKAIEGPCVRAQDIYDQITDHGRKVPPTSEEAVKMAIEKAGKGEQKKAK